jgi:uncharacterized protein DUF1360
MPEWYSVLYPRGCGGGAPLVNDWFRFAMAALAVWRVTHLLSREDGPWDVVARLRNRAGESFLGKLLDCFLCLSLWVAAAVAFVLAPRPRDWILAWLALSGAACLLDRIGHDPVFIQSMKEEKGGDENAVLRSESGEEPRGGGAGGSGNFR